MLKINIGKAHLNISLEGCLDCGTLWSSGWTVAKKVACQIGERKFELEVHRCADCQKVKPGTPVLL